MNSMFGLKSPRNIVYTALLLSIFFCFQFSAWSQDEDQRKKGSEDLPDGQGKEVVQKACRLCHRLDRLTRALGHTREEWKRNVDQMVDYGSPLTKEQIPVVVDYLSKSFPSTAKPPVMVPGPVEVVIKEWTAKRGAFPHDPLSASDGSVWYTGMQGNHLGRFDPKTEKFKEYPVKKLRSSPHGLDEDKDGNIWFTAQGGSYIGKLDPKTGEITEFPLPKPKGTPHTPKVDPKGNIWFTTEYNNQIGRLIPKTGEIKLVNVPTPDAGPYGLVLNSKGIPWIGMSRTNMVASINPDTMEIKEYRLPRPGATVRRLTITSDDMVYYADYTEGMLGRLDPTTGNIKEWPSPGGKSAAAYAITSIGKIVWYSESGVRPNTVVRFDPATEKFQTWAIPSGGYTVRNMSAGRDGKIWLACSGQNGIAMVEVKEPASAKLSR